jgi:hypothetical protein
MRVGRVQSRKAPLFIVVLLQALFATAGEGQQPWISLVTPTSYTLYDPGVPKASDSASQAGQVASSDVAVISIPVTLSDTIDKTKVRIQLRDVRRAGQFDERFWKAFKVSEKLEDAAGRGLVIPLTVDLATASRQGTYDVSLIARQEGVPTPIILSLQIVRPAAKLRPLDTVVDQVAIPILGGSSVIKGSILLEEIGRASRLSEIALRPSEFHDPSGATLGKRLVFSKPANLMVNPGLKAAAAYTLAGSFPLGTNKGKAEVDSPNLEQPMIVSWEVRVRRDRTWLALALFTGLLIGYISRTLLAHAIQVGKARAQGFELRDQIDTELARRPDSVFQERVRKLRALLEEAIQKGAADALPPAIQTASTDLREALKDLEARRTAAESRLAEAQRALTPTWSLPKSLAEPLAEMRAGFEAVRVKLQTDDIAGSGEALDELQKLGQDKLISVLRKWRRQARNGLVALREDAAEALSAPVANSLGPAVDALLGIMDQQIPGTDAALDFPQMASRFQGVNNFRLNLADWLVQVRRWIKDLEGKLREQFPGEPPEVFQHILDLLGATEKEVQDAGDDPEDGLSVLSEDRLHELAMAWRGAFRDSTQELADDERSQVTALVEAKDYLQAAELVVRLTSSQTQGLESVAEDFQREAPLSAGLFLASWSARPTMVHAVGDVTRVLRVEALPRPVLIDPSQNRLQLARAKLASWLISLVLLGILGFVFFGPTWTGDWTQCAAAFFWAFGLDVTMDTVIKHATLAAGR